MSSLDYSKIKLSPSEILWKKELERVEELLDTHKLIFVRGKPGIGKTTYLHQLQSALSNEVLVWVEFRNEVDLIFALSQIAEQLGQPYVMQTKNIQSELDELRSHCLKLLETTDKIIILDNINLIIDVAPFLNEAMQHPLSCKIIAGCREVPALDPMRIMDCGFVDIDGFDLQQTREFLTKCHVKLEESKLDELSLAVQKASEFNPSLLKWMLAPLLFSRKPLELGDVQSLGEAAKKKYISEIFSKLPATITETLNTASCIQYDDFLESEILSQIPTQLRSTLTEAGLIDSFENKIKLQSALRQIILSAIPSNKRKAISEQIISLIKAPESFESYKEVVYQRLTIGDRKTAAKIVNDIFNYFEIKGDAVDFLKLTDNCSEYLNLKSFVRRRFLLNHKSQISKSLFESQIYINRTDISKMERQIVQSFMASDYWRIGKKSEVHRIYSTLSLEGFECDVAKTICLGTLAHVMISDGDRAGASEILDKLPKVSLNEIEEHLFESYYDSLTLQAHLLENLGYFEKALETYVKIEEISKDKTSLGSKIVNSLNTSNTRYRLGQIHRSLEELKQSMARLRTLEAAIPEGWARYDCAIHQMNQGFYEDALKSLDLPTNGIICNSHTKNVALHALLQFRLNRNIDESFIENHSKHFSHIDLQFFLFLKRMTDPTQLHSNDCDMLLEFDAKTNLRLSVINIFMETAYLYGLSLDVGIMNKISNPKKSQKLDFFIEVERKVLTGLHLIQCGKTELAEQLLKESQLKSEKSDFFIWQVRSSLGLALIAYLKGHLHQSASIAETAISVSRMHKFSFELANLIELHQLAEKNIEEISCTRPLIANSILKFRSRPETKLKYIGPKGSFDIRKDEIDNFKEPICLNLEEDSLVIKSQNIDLQQKPILKSTLDLFFKNPNKVFDKEELVTLIWLESYNPLHHDSRIYTTIKRLRELLRKSKVESSIENKNGGFVFIPKENVAIFEKRDELQDLTARQRWVITYCRKNGSITRSTVEKGLKISPSLAGNELKFLVETGWFKKSGSGKSVIYLSQQS